MELAVKEAPTTFVDGMRLHEFHNMLSMADSYQHSQMEQYVAQKSPHGYIVGLKIGTMFAKVEDLTTDQFKFEAWSAKLDELYQEQASLVTEDEGWGVIASHFGAATARQAPLNR
jgi:hypothetical protein